MKLAKKINKTAVVSGVCDGFIGNRMIEQYSRQALFMLDEGASRRRRHRDREVRLRDGAVPHERPRRQRHRLGDPQAPLCRAPRDALLEARRPAVRARAASARRPARAGTTTSRATAPPYPSKLSTNVIATSARSRHRARARSATRKSSTGSCSRWSTKARRSSRRASRRRSDIDMVYLTATASRSGAAGRCVRDVGL